MYGNFNWVILLISEFTSSDFKSLSSKTITRHTGNIDFYVNVYLLRNDIIPAEEGLLYLGGFLGDYFIRTAMWSSEATIKENISSFKKFYSYLTEQGVVHQDDLEEMKEIIKEEKEEWLELVRRI